MKQTMTFYDFQRWFENVRPNNFSREGLVELFNYFEEFEEGTGEEWEFDGIALCCDFTEYEDLDEFKANYTCQEYQEIEDWDGLEDYTTTIPLGNSKKGCIIQNF